MASATTMEQEGLDFHIYKYVPKNVVLTVNGETYEYEDGCITYMNILHEYTLRRLPVIQVGMEMEVDIIQEIYDNLDTAQLKFDINEVEYDQKDNVINTTLYLQQTLSIIPARDENVYITSTDTETKENMDVMKTLQNFEFYLIDMEKVNWFTTEVDAIFESATYAAMLQAMFVMRDIPSQIIIATPPEQSGSVTNVSIPIEDLIHNIRHINSEYGIYDTIPIVYYDMEYMYCLSKREPNIRLESATDFGTVTFVLINPEKPTHNITGSCDDAENGTHWVNLNSQPIIFDTQTRDTSAKVSTVTTVDKSGTVNKTTIDDNATTMRYVFNSNELSSAQLLNESMTGPTVSLMALNCGAKFIKPYKDYTFVSDTSYQWLGLDGKIFRLTRFVLGIHREGKLEYTNEVSLSLYTPTRNTDENTGTNG